MYQHEYQDFQSLMRDLCEAYNRPLKDDLVRVFWEALKEFPLQRIRARAKLHMTNAKKFPTPAELRPPDDQKPKPTGPSPTDLIDAHLRTLGLTAAQHRGLTWLGKAGSITGVQIPTADGSGTFCVMLQDVNA